MFLIFLKKLLLWIYDQLSIFFIFFLLQLVITFFSISDLIACFSLRALWSLTRLLLRSFVFYLCMFYIRFILSFYFFVLRFILSVYRTVYLFCLYFILSSCHTFHWSKLKRSSSSSSKGSKYRNSIDRKSI